MLKKLIISALIGLGILSISALSVGVYKVNDTVKNQQNTINKMTANEIVQESKLEQTNKVVVDLQNENKILKDKIKDVSSRNAGTSSTINKNSKAKDVPSVKKAVNKQVKAVVHTDNDKYNGQYDLLYKVVEAEAGANSPVGKMAVTDVILNRVKSNKFPNSINGVINQRYQFEPVYNGTVYNMHPAKSTIVAVNKELAGHRILPAGVLYFVSNDLDRNNQLWHNFSTYAVYGDNTFLK